MTTLETISLPHFRRIHDYVGAWAIEPASAHALMRMAKGSDLFAHVAEAKDSPHKMESALATQPDGRGKTLAVVPISGVMMKHQSSMGGGVSTVQIRRDVRMAANSDEISAILLLVDSPGGTVAGTADLGEEIRTAAKKKPVFAYVSDLCASAAYWVASQADAIFANNATALVGSIGTVMTMYDVSKAAEQQGVETLVFATGPLKGAGSEGSVVTEEQRSYFQSLVDDAQRSFDAAVKKGRSMTDTQLKNVRTGGVFGAVEAQELKLIDGIQSLESTMEALVREAHSRSRRSRSAEADPIGPSAVAERPEEAEVEAPTQPAEPLALKVRILKAGL